MSKVIKKFRVNDKIPEGAKFLYQEELPIGPARKESISINYGILWDTERYRIVQDTERVFYYECDDDNPQQEG